MQQAQQNADPGSRTDAQPRRAAEACDGISGHGASHQNALQPQVDPAALFGQAFAQADEQKRCADADGSGQQSEQKGSQVDISHVAVLPCRAAQAPPSA